MAAVVTKKGREIVTFRLKGTPSAGTEPLNIGWGTGAGTASANDVALFAESAESRTAGTSSFVTTTTTNDTYQVVGTLTASGARTITEVALSDSSTKPASTTINEGGTFSNVDTTLTVTSNTGFSGLTPPFNIQIDSEVLTVTAGQGGTSWTVTRGANGSSNTTHADGSVITAGNIPGSTSSGAAANLFLHAEHGSVSLATSDSIAYTIKTQIT